MLNKIAKNLAKIHNYNSQNYLLAVSGGVDSMVLIRLFQKLNLRFGIAHCNFNLRESSSDLDAELVKSSAKVSNIKHFETTFETSKFAKEKGISTQMAARELRYSWFNKLALENQFNFIVTAHHLNDQIETVFLNLTRGSGVEGITGMNFKNENLIRPLLTVTKEEILAYAKTENITFREDESNKSNKYKRNLIRNKIIPLFEELNPSFLKTMEKNISNFNSVAKIYEKAIEKELSDNLIVTKENQFLIEIEKLKTASNPINLLFEFIKKFGFNIFDSEEIIGYISSEYNGEKEFKSSSHELIIDRNTIVLFPKKEIDSNVSLSKEVIINKEDKEINSPVNLSFTTLEKEEFKLMVSNKIAYFDYDKIKFPLTIRKWKSGDYFYPFGMKGKKKLSDFFIDNKLSNQEKSEVYVLVSEEKIIWVIGFRSGEKQKINNKTKQVLKVEMT